MKSKYPPRFYPPIDARVALGSRPLRLIEINHKAGGGGMEMRAKTSPRFYRDIARLIRPCDDLNLLCRVCNAAHYLESKYGDLPFLIVWGARRVR